MNTSKLLMKFKFLETIDENEFNNKYEFENTLLALYQKLKNINYLNSKIKITGYWAESFMLFR